MVLKKPREEPLSWSYHYSAMPVSPSPSPVDPHGLLESVSTRKSRPVFSKAPRLARIMEEVRDSFCGWMVVTAVWLRIVLLLSNSN